VVLLILQSIIYAQLPLTRYSKYLKRIHALSDLVMLNGSFIGMFFVKHGAFHDPFTTMLVYINIAWFVAVSVTKPYDISRASSLGKILISAFGVLTIHLLLVFAFYVFEQSHRYSRELLLMMYSGTFVLMFSYRIIFHFAIRHFRKKGFNYRNVIIVSHDEDDPHLFRHITSHPEYGYHVKKVIHADKEEAFQQSLIDECRENDIHEIFYPISLVNYNSFSRLMNFAEENLIRVRLVADFRWVNFRDLEIERIGGMPVLKLHTTPLDNWDKQLAKRIFDIVFSVLVIIFVLSWLMPLIALLIKLDSRGPVFFRQARTGRDNSSFLCFKLRTMYVNEHSDTLQATKNDSRITRIGKFLRDSSLDELPQFFNVLMGDMSVVGPRPHMLRHTTEFSAEVDKFMLRHKIKPGITGLAQSKGYRGETDDFEKKKNRVKLDLFYVNNWSFLLDIKIIFDTVKMVLKPQH